MVAKLKTSDELSRWLDDADDAVETLDDLNALADRCGRREGESVAELLKRLYDETLDDND